MQRVADLISNRGNESLQTTFVQTCLFFYYFLSKYFATGGPWKLLRRIIYSQSLQQLKTMSA